MMNLTKRNFGVRYPQLINALTSKVWAIEPGYLNAIAQSLYQASHNPGMEKLAQAGPQIIEPKEETQETETPGQIAIVPVHGVIGKYLSWMEMECGGFSLEQFEDDMTMAANDERITSIIMHVHSPGGVTDGIDAGGRLVADIAKVKPVYVFTDSLMASAAYWLAASASMLFATPLADVGSIGVFMAWVDHAKWMEKEGLELKIFKAGRMKAMHLPGQLTDEAAEHLQGQIDSIYDEFTGWVTKYRELPEDAMQGQCFLGKDAVAQGLVDEVVPSLADLIHSIQEGGV